MVTIKVLSETTQAMRSNCTLDLLSKVDPQVKVLSRRAVVMDSIPISASSIATSRTVSLFEHMKDVVIVEPPHLKVDLIIGADLGHTFAAPTQFRRGPAYLPLATLTDWGWCVDRGERASQTLMTSFFVNLDNEHLSPQLQQMWEIDFRPLPGDNEECRWSQEEKAALDAMEQSVKYKDGITRWPLHGRPARKQLFTR